MSHSVTLIWGPPCGGKSTIVDQLADRGDLILDPDRLHHALSGLGPHDHDPVVSTYVRAAWDAVLRELQRPHSTNAFVQAGVPTRDQRAELASVVTESRLVYADRDTCHERATAAERPDAWHHYIDRWHDTFEPDLSERSDNMNYERRTESGGVEVREEGDTVVATGYAAVFDRLSQNLGGFVERVAPGTFRSTLKQADVRALWNHEPDHLLGRSGNGTLRMVEDGKGLRYEVDLPNTTLGRDVAELLRRGDITGSSFGFRTISDDWGTTEDGYPLRTLTEVALRDVGPVAFQAYSDSEASLRSLAEGRSLDLQVLVRAAEEDTLADVISTPDSDEEPEPGDTHSILRHPGAIR